MAGTDFFGFEQKENEILGGGDAVSVDERLFFEGRGQTTVEKRMKTRCSFVLILFPPFPSRSRGTARVAARSVAVKIEERAREKGRGWGENEKGETQRCLCQPRRD